MTKTTYLVEMRQASDDLVVNLYEGDNAEAARVAFNSIAFMDDVADGVIFSNPGLNILDTYGDFKMEVDE